MKAQTEKLREKRILIVGCGYVGEPLAQLLAARGIEVWGVRRNPIEGRGYRGLAWDIAKAYPWTTSLPYFDAVIYMVSAGERTAEGYHRAYVQGLQNVVTAVAKLPPRRFLFVSSTGVYHQDDGAWVDESSDTKPTSFSGQLLLDGEGIVKALAYESCVVRLSGIYGPGRCRAIESVRSNKVLLSRAPKYGNRIHRDDCARALAHLVDLENPHPLYNVTDCEPADWNDVYRYLAQVCGKAPPPLDESHAVVAGKRVDNQRLIDSGLIFVYPTFREGYRSLF